jgi:hypothetical protein
MIAEDYRSVETIVADFAPSRFLTFLKSAAWVSVLTGVGIGIVGGFLIHPGVGLIAVAYFMQSLSAGLVQAEGVQTRREVGKYADAEALRRYAAQSYMAKGQYDTRKES